MQNLSSILQFLICGLLFLVASNTLARYWIRRIHQVQVEVALALREARNVQTRTSQQIAELDTLYTKIKWHEHVYQGSPKFKLPSELLAQVDANIERDRKWKEAHQQSQAANNHQHRRKSDSK